MRGKDDVNGYRFEAYLGINKNNFKIKNNKKIYVGQLLALNAKSTQAVGNINLTLHGPAKYFRTDEMGREARNYVHDPKDLDWRNEKFWEILLRLLGGEGWKPFTDYSVTPSLMGYKKEGMIIKSGFFYSDVVYWNQYRNLLKGISYQMKP